MSKDRRTTQVNVMMTGHEYKMLGHLAAAMGLSMSATIRNLVLTALYARNGPAPALEAEAGEETERTGSDPAPYSGTDTSAASTV